MSDTKKAVHFGNGLFIVERGRTYHVESLRDEDDGDWKTAMARGYKGIKMGQRALLHEVWDNMYGRWARIELDGRKFDVRPAALVMYPEATDERG